MSILKIMAVRDIKADAFQRPFFSPGLGVGLRALGDEVGKPHEGNTMNSHPEDFEFYLLGEFDDNTGEFNTHKPKQVGLATDFVKSKK